MKFLSFDHFFMTAYIKIIFILGLIGLGFGLIAGIVSAFSMMNYSVTQGLGTILLSIIGVAIGAIWWRLLCEMMIVFFRIYEELHMIRCGESSNGASTLSANTPAPVPSWRTGN